MMDLDKIEPTELRELVIDHDRCPECNGELDTGWECNDCGFDARPELKRSPSWKAEHGDLEE